MKAVWDVVLRSFEQWRSSLSVVIETSVFRDWSASVLACLG
jgi:hypothetical protein